MNLRNAPFFVPDEYENVNLTDSWRTDDLCVIENRDHFVRAVLEIPLVDSDDYFGWGVWVSLKKENFETYREQYDTDQIGPFFGWLCTEISFFDEPTLNLPTTIKFVGNGIRPRVFINECNHILRKQQTEGISTEDAWKTVDYYSTRA